ncbi:MAG TPA: DMT family transporter [bacterium]|nr:DMT family transporter [bacterium]
MDKNKARLFSIIISILAGMGLAIMMQINATLGQKVGLLESSFIVHLAGMTLAIVLLNTKLNKDFIVRAKTAPKIYFLAGVFGVLMVIVANYLVPKIGMAVCVSLFVTTALVLTTLVDHIGIFNLARFKITPKRVAGLVLAIGGVVMLIWG